MHKEIIRLFSKLRIIVLYLFNYGRKDTRFFETNKYNP